MEEHGSSPFYIITDIFEKVWKYFIIFKTNLRTLRQEILKIGIKNKKDIISFA